MISNEILLQKEIELQGEKYLVYLKRVATKLEGGLPISTTIRAFIKKQ
jgi:hypothetical protein